MSMNPDGSNRIIRQQAKEWSAERDGDRNARLLKSGPSESRPWLGSLLLRQAGAVLAWPVSLIRQHRTQEQVD